MKQKALIVGCGYVGSRLRELLLEESWDVTSIRRSKTKEPGFLSCDVSQAFDLEEDYSHVFYLVSASSYTKEAYEKAYVEGVRNTLEALKKRKSKARFILVSSTSVFSENSGGTVTEDSPVDRESFASQALLEGEKLVAESSLESSSVRFAGIYGPGRDRMIRTLLEGKASFQKESYISNRIHREDCARILYHLAVLKSPFSLYIATDSLPTPYNEVLRWLSVRLDKPVLKRKEEVSSRRLMSSKYCENKRLLNSGYIFQYPSYREGFLNLLEAMEQALL